MVSLEVLRRYPFFAGIREASLKAVAMIAEARAVAAGTEVFHEGDPADTFGIITQGEVNIQYTLGTGERRTVDTLGEGDIFTWSALGEPYKTTATATAIRPTRLVAMDAKRLRALCDEDPQLGFRLMSEVARLLARRLEGTRVQLATVA